MIGRPPSSTLFPYTPLSRSVAPRADGMQRGVLPRVAARRQRHRLQGGLPRENALDFAGSPPCRDRKSTRLNSSHSQISYAVFCLKKKNNSLTSTYYPRV